MSYSMSNLRKSIFYLQQDLRDELNGEVPDKRLIDALDLLAEVHIERAENENSRL